MSIADDLTRIQGAKADIKAAIESKGVSVPSSALLDEYAPYIEAIEGGGSQGFTRHEGQSFGVVSSNSLAFAVVGEPKAFVIASDFGEGNEGALMIVGDSTGCHGVYNTGSQHNYSAGFTKSYSNGTLTITAPSGISLYAENYRIVYYTGSGTLTFKTSQVQPGSGVTAVTFTGTGLTEVPAMYACMLESQVNNESYRRVAGYTNSTTVSGQSASMGITFLTGGPVGTTSSFSVSYNNGLVINSGGTNAGGYFHNPGTYTLYYLMASDIGGEAGPNLQNKTVTPTTSQQSVTADSGYDGLGTVTVSAIQTETKTATPSTSQQTINATSGKYMTSVTVSAVTSSIDANITAGNIKSGTTILGVTGTYSGSGATLVPTAGDYPVVGNGGLGGGGNALTSTGISITIPVSGTYRLKWCAFRRANSTGYTWSSRLYRRRNNTTEAIGTEITTWTSTYYQANSLDIACEAGDIIYVYVAGRSNSYSWGGMLTACVAQKLWTN